MLSLRCVLPNLPMVAVLSAAHLAALILPVSLRRLYVAVDNDTAGRSAASELMNRARDVGVDALPLVPTADDFNTDLRTSGTATLASALRPQLAPEDVARFLVLAGASA